MDLKFTPVRRKPVVVGTCRLTRELWDNIYLNYGRSIKAGEFNLTTEIDSNGVGYFGVNTLEDVDNKLHRGEIGDWLIRGVHREIFAIKPDIFEETYEMIINLDFLDLPNAESVKRMRNVEECVRSMSMTENLKLAYGTEDKDGDYPWSER